MFETIERLMLFAVGVIFIAAGGRFVIDSMEANDLIESVLFGLMAVVIGIFLILMVFIGPFS